MKPQRQSQHQGWQRAASCSRRQRGSAKSMELPCARLTALRALLCYPRVPPVLLSCCALTTHYRNTSFIRKSQAPYLSTNPSDGSFLSGGARSEAAGSSISGARTAPSPSALRAGHFHYCISHSAAFPQPHRVVLCQQVWCSAVVCTERHRPPARGPGRSSPLLLLLVISPRASTEDRRVSGLAAGARRRSWGPTSCSPTTGCPQVWQVVTPGKEYGSNSQYAGKLAQTPRKLK